MKEEPLNEVYKGFPVLKGREVVNIFLKMVKKFTLKMKV